MRPPPRRAGAVATARRRLRSPHLLAATGRAAAAAGRARAGVRPDRQCRPATPSSSYDRTGGGTPAPGRRYPTGGLRRRARPARSSTTWPRRARSSYDRGPGLLYAVNAGSDTITVFAVHGDRLVRRQVIASGGDFPVSITAHGNLVYVLNARDGGSIQGFLRIGDVLVAIPAWHRDLGLDPTQTPEFTSTPGQVAFTPDGSQAGRYHQGQRQRHRRLHRQSGRRTVGRTGSSPGQAGGAARSRSARAGCWASPSRTEAGSGRWPTGSPSAPASACPASCMPRRNPSSA